MERGRRADGEVGVAAVRRGDRMTADSERRVGERGDILAPDDGERDGRLRKLPSIENVRRARRRVAARGNGRGEGDRLTEGRGIARAATVVVVTAMLTVWDRGVATESASKLLSPL